MSLLQRLGEFLTDSVLIVATAILIAVAGPVLCMVAGIVVLIAGIVGNFIKLIEGTKPKQSFRFPKLSVRLEPNAC